MPRLGGAAQLCVGAALQLMTLVAAFGCGGPTSPAQPPEPSVEVLIPHGATTIVSLAPSRIFASDVMRSVALAVMPEDRLVAFRARHGVDLRTLDRLIVAEYPSDDDASESTTAYVARGPFHAEVVVAEIGNRMSPLESREDRPVMRRAGHYLLRRFELLALGPTTVALTDGPPAFAGRLVETQRTAQARADSMETQFSAPLVLMRHGRPDLPPTGVGLLLARLEHTVVSFDAVGPALEVDVHLDGAFPPGAEANFRSLVSSIAESDMGQALGMDEVEATLTVTATPSAVSMHATVDSQTLAAGLRALVGAEMDELLDLK